ELRSARPQRIPWGAVTPMLTCLHASTGGLTETDSIATGSIARDRESPLSRCGEGAWRSAGAAALGGAAGGRQVGEGGLCAGLGPQDEGVGLGPAGRRPGFAGRPDPRR